MTDAARNDSGLQGTMTTNGMPSSTVPNGAIANGAMSGAAMSGAAVSGAAMSNGALSGNGVGARGVSSAGGIPSHAKPALADSSRSNGQASFGASAMSGDARLGSEPESGIHQAVHVSPRGGTPPMESAPSPDLILLGVTETQVPPGWIAAEEELEQHELTVMVRGTLCTTREDGEASSGPVEALLFKPGTRRQERNGGEVDLHRLRISFHWKNAPAELPESVQDTCGRLHEIASWLVAERDAQFPNVSDYRQGLLRALIGEYLRLSVVAASRIEEKTRTYMLRHLGEPITLEDLATNIGMSRYYFCRVYKEVAGHTPMEHLRALRLERAKDLIRSTALPLKAIAPEVGFGSAQHLCRLLHDRFGVGVRELRGAGTLESRGVPSSTRDSEDMS